MSQPFGLSCKGGLNTNLNQLEMLKQPGFATKLINFEVDPDGGYRRVNGFEPFGGASATRPESGQVVHGIFPYALGIVVCVGTSVYYSEDGVTWIQVNYDTGHSGVTQANLSSQTELDRPSQGQAQFVLMRAAEGHTTNPYGSLTIATAGGDKLAHFHIDGTGASRLFVYEELTTPAAGTFVEEHDKHLCVVDATNAPSTVYYSKTNSDRNFTGTGSGAVTFPDRIEGIKSFRNSLFVFCRNSIHRLDNINDPATIQSVQITRNIGCISGYSIQEIGGNLVFLSPDGIRTVAGTERIGDIELGSISRNIQKIISDISNNINLYIINSTVLKYKSQYRLFYSTTTQNPEIAKGVIGTFTGEGFEWSETQGIQAFGLVSEFDVNVSESSYHGDKNGYIYIHDSGNSFYNEGTSGTIRAIYQTPNLDFGDVGTRKTLKYVKTSFNPEGLCSSNLFIKYDYEDVNIVQPEAYSVSTLPPAVFGSAVFGTARFGGTTDPMIRTTVEGSGFVANFKYESNAIQDPFSINGIYIDYMPSGRR